MKKLSRTPQKSAVKYPTNLYQHRVKYATAKPTTFTFSPSDKDVNFGNYENLK